MTHNLRLVKGGREPSAELAPVKVCSPDQSLFALIDEARVLETRDRLFNRQVETIIEESASWLKGDRQAALESNDIQRLREEHKPVIDRLLELPNLIAETPAHTRDGVIVKMRYLVALLDGVEVDILESAIDDIEYLR